jgi:hypothetical protein
MSNLYYVGDSPERVKILEVKTCGICKTINRQGEISFNFIGNLKKVY